MYSKKTDMNYSFIFSLLMLLLISTDSLMFHHLFITRIIEGYGASLLFVVLADWLLLIAQKIQMLQSINMEVKHTIGHSIEQMKKNVLSSPPGEIRKKQRKKLLELNKYDRNKSTTILQNEVSVLIVKAGAKLLFFLAVLLFPLCAFCPLAKSFTQLLGHASTIFSVIVLLASVALETLFPIWYSHVEQAERSRISTR